MWSCHKCHFESSTSTDWLDHLRDCHQQQYSDCQASAAITRACRKTPKPVEEEKCFLCDKYPSNTRRALISHIGKHMEEVAMMALPKDHMDDSEHSSESDDGNFDIDDQSNDTHRKIDAVKHKQSMIDSTGTLGDGFGAPVTSTDAGSLICGHPGCDCSFDSEQHLHAHMVDHMATHPRGYRCPYCVESVTDHGKLSLHLREHRLEKPYFCGDCKARFRRNHDLKRHSKLHISEIIHACPECGQSFTRADALARHMHTKGCGGKSSGKKNLDSKGDTISHSGIEDILSKPRCQRCVNVKNGCDRQRPCQRCKDNGIGLEGCISEGEDSGMKDQSRSYRDVYMKGDIVYVAGNDVPLEIVDTPSNNDERVQNQDYKLRALIPGSLKDGPI